MTRQQLPVGGLQVFEENTPGHAIHHQVVDNQQQALAARLPDTPVALGMSYGSPSLASAVDDLLAQGVEHIVVLPLYPQYSCSTVAAVWDELARILAKKRAIP
ncbi:ferrochelatase, partial [Pseudomonas aeruginosa]|nr:ferrochelatase [Pseudomonas aeruginosa]